MGGINSPNPPSWDTPLFSSMTVKSDRGESCVDLFNFLVKSSVRLIRVLVLSPKKKVKVEVKFLLPEILRKTHQKETAKRSSSQPHLDS